MIEKFLSGDVELYLRELNSLVNLEPGRDICVRHASLRDFFVDPTRSKTFWINRQARHTAFARHCLQVLQNPGKQDHSPQYSHSHSEKQVYVEILWIG